MSKKAWAFGKGINSPSSLYSVQTGAALAVDPTTLFGSTYKYKGGKDPFPVPSAAYGDTNLKMVPRKDQQACERRGCENYGATQQSPLPLIQGCLKFLDAILSGTSFQTTRRCGGLIRPSLCCG